MEITTRCCVKTSRGLTCQNRDPDVADLKPSKLPSHPRMNKISIPKTDLHASTLALGTDYFGSTVSRDLCMELMDHYIEAGGNMIDTAESYARWLPGGEYQSEKVIGE